MAIREPSGLHEGNLARGRLRLREFRRRRGRNPGPDSSDTRQRIPQLGCSGRSVATPSRAIAAIATSVLLVSVSRGRSRPAVSAVSPLPVTV